MDNVKAERIEQMMDAMDKIAQGKTCEVPGHILVDLAKRADAEISALDQLQDILDAHSKK